MATEQLLISEKVIKTLLPISNSLAGDYIRPAIVIAQDKYLEATIGTALTNKLKEDVRNQKITGPYSTLLDDYVVKMLAQYTCAGIIQNVATKIANAGVVRTEEEKLSTVSSDEITELRNRYMRDGDMYRLRLQRYIYAHYSDFPELSEWRSCGELKAQLKNSTTGGLWLGGTKGYNRE
ncbi:MAG: DUF6712 family protein [Paludibacteraceae bacterium]|jgi:hypothetical protein|nr:DUF6712 family protein [Paludibacteraceae bacterium]